MGDNGRISHLVDKQLIKKKKIKTGSKGGILGG